MTTTSGPFGPPGYGTPAMPVAHTTFGIKLAAWMIGWLCLFFVGCTTPDPIAEYLAENPDLPPETIFALRNRQIINRMNADEVMLVLGEPTFLPHTEGGIERWVYRENPVGIEHNEAYSSGSAFPSGIGFVIPLRYRSNEIRIDFQEGRVCQIQEILSF